MTNSQIRKDVQAAFERDPLIDAAAIAVAVADGVVTLRGEVRSHFEKHDAERIALGVWGVAAVANELVVVPPGSHPPTDTEIAQAAVDALTWNALVPLHAVHVLVCDGCVTLSGTLEWEYQRTSAEHTVAKIAGVKGVSNAITLKTPEPVRTAHAHAV